MGNPAKSEQLSNTFIEWVPVKGAIKYRLVIKDFGDAVVLKKDLVQSRLDLNLPHGEYLWRIAIFHKFNKIQSWSKWFKLSIVPALEPELISISPKVIFADNRNYIISLKGKNFNPSTVVKFKNKKNDLEVVETMFIDKSTLEVEVRSNSESYGKFDVYINNTDDFSVYKKGFLKIKRKLGGKFYNHHVGIDLGYYTQALNINDVYTGYMGFKIFYELHSPGTLFKKLAFLKKAPGFYPAVRISFYGFLNPVEYFGESYMLQFELYVGYDFSFYLTKDLMWHLGPFFGYKHYIRWHEYEGINYTTFRPTLPLGFNLSFDLPQHFFIGLSVDYNIIFDDTIIHNMGIFIRCGYKI